MRCDAVHVYQEGRSNLKLFLILLHLFFLYKLIYNISFYFVCKYQNKIDTY